MDATRTAAIGAVPARVWRAVKLRAALVVAIYVLASLLFTGLYRTATAEHSKIVAPQIIAGTFSRPHQYRMLLPIAARTLHHATGWPVMRTSWLLTFGTVLGILFAHRRYLRHFLSKADADGWALSILYPMAWNYCVLNAFYFPCDMPAILLFLLGLDALHRGAWIRYCVIFAIATLNRETSLFLTAAYLVVARGSHSPGRLCLGGLLQILIWLGIKAGLASIYGDNPGSPWEWRLAKNLSWFTTPGFHTVLRLFTFGGIWMLLPFACGLLPQPMRRLLWLAIPFFAAMLLVGEIGEVRIYNELIPVLVPPAILVAMALWREASLGGQLGDVRL